VNILPTVDDWADNTTALSGMSDVELETSLPNRETITIIKLNN